MFYRTTHRRRALQNIAARDAWQPTAVFVAQQFSIVDFKRLQRAAALSSPTREATAGGRAEASALDVAAASPTTGAARLSEGRAGARLARRRLVNDEGRELTPSELAMRARRRRFKDEFLPRATYDKHRDGYYFGTGARGTGYYL